MYLLYACVVGILLGHLVLFSFTPEIYGEHVAKFMNAYEAARNTGE